ncbi:Hypothetical predicted protein, partial [Mytilus galloprovincialis]
MANPEYDFLFKMVLVGDDGVGKSCLMSSFAEGKQYMHTANYMPTIGVDFKIRTINVEGRVIKLQLWDTAGAERFRSITTSFTEGAMVCYYLDILNQGCRLCLVITGEELQRNGVVIIYDITNRGAKVWLLSRYNKYYVHYVFSYYRGANVWLLSMITNSYYRGANGVVIIYDITIQKSFDNVPKWVKEVESYANPNSKTILIGNKGDLESERIVDYSTGKKFADSVGLSFAETSAKISKNVEQAFLTLVSDIKNKSALDGVSAPSKLNASDVG